MNFSRRNFVKLGGIAAIASLGLSNFAYGKTASDVLANQTADDFRKLIGTEFYLANNDISTVATLVGVKDFQHKPINGESFSLEFQVPPENSKEDIYQIQHSELGNFELFMTASKNGKNQVLIATITRI